jgi:hypothetical protein
MLCAGPIDAKDENKEVGAVLHAFYKYLSTSAQHGYVKDRKCLKLRDVTSIISKKKKK